MGLLEDFGFSEDDNSSYDPEVQDDNVVVPAPLDAPTDVSALRRSNINDPRGMVDFIRQVAMKYGIDPDVAVAVARSEGLSTFQSSVPVKNGPNGREDSWGAFQLYKGGGLGNEFQRLTGLDPADPRNERETIEFALSQAAKVGWKPWYGAKNTGIGQWDGINRGGNGTNYIAYAPEPDAQFPNYAPPTKDRRTGAAPGVGYISNNDGGWTPAGDEPPQAMFYGPIRQNTNRTPAYIRGASPGLQANFVPPEMRGPFRASLKVPYNTAVATVGNPVTPSVDVHLGKLDPTLDYPGLPQDRDEDNAIPAQLAALLQPSEPVAPILDESAGLNLARTAVNTSIPSVDPVIDESAGLNLQLPTPNLPPKDQASLLVTKGTLEPDAPSVPISGDNMPTPSFIEAQLPDAPKPAAPSAMDMVNTFTETPRQIASKFTGNLSAMPLMMGGALSAAADWGSNSGGVTQWFIDRAQANKDAADWAFGVPEKSATIGGRLGGWLGEIITPWGAYTVPATVLTGIASIGSNFIQSAMAKEKTMPQAVAEQLLFPGTGNNQMGPLTGPRVTHTVPTAAGPVQLSAPNYNVLGIVGAATIGALIVPSAVKAIINRALPGRIGRDPVNPSTGIQLYSNPADLVHMSHDRFAPINRIGRDLGLNPVILKNIQDSFEFQTGSASRALTSSAMMDGKAVSRNFNYDVPVSIGKLAQVEMPDYTQYMTLWHQYDQVKEKQRIMMTKNQQQILATGVPTVQGMNDWQIKQAIRTMEATPNGQSYRDFRQEYLMNQKETWRIESTGEYATKSSADLKASYRTEMNNIWQKVDEGNTDFTPGPVTASFADDASKRLRIRMENEARGKTIDEITKVQPDFSRKIEDVIDPNTGDVIKTARQVYEENAKSWAPNLVTFQRRGVTEYHLTDPMVARILMTDPYALNGRIGQWINAPRKFVEQTTTGIGAPVFALTTMFRNHLLQRISDTSGFSTAHFGRTLAAVPQQLYPQMAKHFSQRLDHWSDGWVSSVFPGGQNGMQAMSTRLAQVYDQSTYALLMHRGGVHTSMFLDYNAQTSQSIGKVLQAGKGMKKEARHFLEGYKALIDSIGNSPVYAYGNKNIKRGANPTEVAQAMRAIVGNNTKNGLFIDKGPGGTIKSIPFDRTNLPFGDQVDALAAKWVLGGVHELGRNLGPWWNVTTQGMKAVGRAYWNDPVKFVGNTYLYGVMPAAALYMYNRGLGVDPNGISYNDYQMNRRSGYNQLMTAYIAIPGLPAEKGLTIPLPHEMAGVYALTNTALHHVNHSEMFGRADDFMRTALALVGKDYSPSITVPLRSAEEDFAKTAMQWASTAFMPAAPSFISAPLGAAGIVMPSGPFGGEAYQKRDTAYDTQQGMPTGIEGFIRGVGPGIGDIIGSGYAAFTHSEDMLSGLSAASKASIRRMVERAPVLRDAIGLRPPVSGATETTAEMFKNKRVIDNLSKYFNEIDPTTGPDERKQGASKQGNAVTNMFMKPAPPRGFGLPAPEPKNQLYKAFIEELRARFKKDTITEGGKPDEDPTGGIGFLSHMQRYKAWTEEIQSMRKIDEGNAVTWTKHIRQNPAIVKYLEDNKVAIDKPREVKNFLELERQTAARQILYTIRAVEQDFQKRLGQDFKFSDLDPNQEMPLPLGFQMAPFQPQMPGYITPQFLQDTAPIRNKKKQ